MAEPIYLAESRIRGRISFGSAGTKPGLTDIGNGRSAFNFSVAVNHSRYNSATQQWVEDGTTWFQVGAFDKLAGLAQAGLEKGMLVEVSGPVRIREYTRPDGSKGQTLQMIASAISTPLWNTSNNTPAVEAPELPMPPAELLS